MRLLITFMVLTVTFLNASTIRSGTLKAQSDGSNIAVQWGTTDESNVREFQVERRNSDGEFVTIAVVAKKGSGSFYEYIDRSAFKSTGSVYEYRIKSILVNGQAEVSDVITVTHNVSSVKRTWGSLKAMFR
ncbi:MAG: hypothetical protein HUU02_12760 [Bacteroidetes bacterium]|nr:hypothetical protein [Bacteroidota bacterium]